MAGPPPDTPCSWTAASSTPQVRRVSVAHGSLAVVCVGDGAPLDGAQALYTVQVPSVFWLFVYMCPQSFGCWFTCALCVLAACLHVPSVFWFLVYKCPICVCTACEHVSSVSVCSYPYYALFVSVQFLY